MNQSRVLIGMNVNITTRASRDLLRSDASGLVETVDIMWGASMTNKLVHRVGGRAY